MAEQSGVEIDFRDIPEGTNTPPANVVRRNVLGILTRSRLITIFYWYRYIASLVQIIAIASVLGATWNQRLESDLRTFLVLYGSCMMVGLVTTFYHHYNHVHIDTLTWRYAEPTTRTGHVFKAFHDFAHTFWLLLVIYGLMVIGSCKGCAKDAPALYGVALAIIVYSFVVLLFPLILLVLFVCSLPFILILARHLVSADAMAHNGADQTSIDAVPLYKFDPDEKRLYGSVQMAQVDAKCSICLSQYREGEELRVLQCRHHYHRGCVDEWFRISGTCPLCVQPIVPSPESA